MRLWNLQNPPRSIPKPSKINPSALQDAKKALTSDKNTARSRKMRPRSAQERKIVPTWFQHGLTNFGRWHARASPKVIKARLLKPLHLIDLSRLGTDERCGGFSALRACHRPLDRAFARVFFNFFGARAPNMHFKIFPGRRDLSTAKFSARYDACSSKKRRKTKTQKVEKIASFERRFTPRGWLLSA